MYNLLVILAVIVAILLIFIVLIQESKGGGLASSFSASNNIMGVRKTTDVVEKGTWILAALIVVLSIATTFVTPQAADPSSIVTDMKSQPAPINMPGQGNGQAAPAQPSAPSAPAQK